MSIEAVQESADAVLPLLANPAGYRACTWDLTEPSPLRDYWINLFERHFPSLLEEAKREAADRGEPEAETEAKLDTALRAFSSYLSDLRANPASHPGLDILTICHAREDALLEAGVPDAYRLAKREANDKAVALLPRLLSDLDAMPEAERIQAIIEGVFAGNIFDLGAIETTAMFKARQVDFLGTRDELRPRPWFVDDLDAWIARLTGGPAYRHVLALVDNAGPDIALGMIPFTRDLLQRGASVTLSANSLPSLNDITHEELVELLDRVEAFDEVVATARREGRLVCLASGNRAPLIDLSRLSRELVEHTRAVRPDLLLLEGMGRSVESNAEAEFTCDALWMAMIKDRGVADSLGAEPFDLRMKFRPIGG